MTDDERMLQSLCEDAQMGRDAVEHVLGLTQDERLRGVLQKQMDGYGAACDAAARLLREQGAPVKDAPTAAKVMTRVSSSMKTMADRSPSKIAQLVIEGNTMGITTTTRQLHSLHCSDPQVRRLADEQLHMEQQNIEQLKPFL